MFRILLLFLVPMVAMGADPKPLVFPILPKIVPVEPAPSQSVVLAAGQWYVVESETPFFLVASPAGVVNIQQEEGPLRIRGTFVETPGRIETRTYTAKYIAIVDAIEGRTGRVELIGIPSGLIDGAQISRRLVDIGAGPRPPPGPTPPTPTPVVTGFRVLLIYESMDAYPRETLNTLHSTVIRDYLTRKCSKDSTNVPEWRVWDKDVVVSAKESPTMRDLWNAVKPQLNGTPKIIVAVNGDAKVYPLPSTEAETLAFLKSIGGE